MKGHTLVRSTSGDWCTGCDWQWDGDPFDRHEQFATAHRTCPATTTGPAEIPCRRTDPHHVGHVFVGGDVADRHEEGVSEQ